MQFEFVINMNIELIFTEININWFSFSQLHKANILRGIIVSESYNLLNQDCVDNNQAHQMRGKVAENFF